MIFTRGAELRVIPIFFVITRHVDGLLETVLETFEGVGEDRFAFSVIPSEKIELFRFGLDDARQFE